MDWYQVPWSVMAYPIFTTLVQNFILELFSIPHQPRKFSEIVVLFDFNPSYLLKYPRILSTAFSTFAPAGREKLILRAVALSKIQLGTGRCELMGVGIGLRVTVPTNALGTFDAP
jgi:hypothetical protein